VTSPGKQVDSAMCGNYEMMMMMIIIIIVMTISFGHKVDNNDSVSGKRKRL